VPGDPIPWNFNLYADAGYLGASNYIIVPYILHPLSPVDHIEFNAMMSRVRITVEWSFGKVAQYFSCFDFKKLQKLLQTRPAESYMVATLLTNCHTCLYGATASSYYHVEPPLLEEYLYLAQPNPYL
jgi:hypothetical protein